jgi:putative flippase GtrA
VDRTFAKFLVVGFSNFLVSFAVFWLCVNAPIQFTFKAGVAQLVAYSVATLWSFFWNRRVTFKSSGPVRRQLTRFVVLQASLAVISAALIGFAVEVVGVSPVISWFVVMSGITIANFILSKWWAFT